MSLLFVLALLASGVAAWRAWRRLRHFLHVYQIEGSTPSAYGSWLRGRLPGGVVDRIVAPSHLGGLGVLLALSFWVDRAPLATGAAACIGWAVAFASAVHVEREPEKKPFVYTDPMKRQATLALALAAVPVAVGALWALSLPGAVGLVPLLSGWLIADLGAPLWAGLSGLLAQPTGGRGEGGPEAQALGLPGAHPDLAVVAITGSDGETSVKLAVAEILRQRYHTLAPPGSCNTPLEVDLIMDEALQPDHQAVVLEMGARYSHSIQQLPEVARPDVVVVAAVAPPQPETVGTAEATARVSGDLVATLRPGGQAVLNADDPRVLVLRERVPADAGRVWTVSAEGREEADLTAVGLTYGPDGARFTVRDDRGETADLQTKLLGAGNVLALLLAAGVGRAMGLSLREIAHAVGRIEPVEHRLALRRENGVVVIDDAFNASPIGARNAVEVLGQMPVPAGGHRVVVTPGVVGTDERHEDLNRLFGEDIARTLTRDGDFAVLVGPRQTASVREGLRAAGFPDERVRTVRSRFEARDWLRTVVREGDVILYENDLPDTDSEG